MPADNINPSTADGPEHKQPRPRVRLIPIDGNALLDDLSSAVRRYLILPPGGAEAIALWVLHAHAHDAADISPILCFAAPEKGSGKTTSLDVLSQLVPKPHPTANMTPSAIFRVIDARKPTLLIDEADTFIRANNELRGVLDSGHKRSMAFITRCVGESYEVQDFSTWAPKAIALIGRLPPTLEDRSITVTMKRRLPTEEVSRLRDGDLSDLQRRAAWWAEENLDRLRRTDPEMPSALQNRAADNWRALLAIADLVGGPWPQRAREAAVQLYGTSEDESYGVMLLHDIKAVFDAQTGGTIPSAELCVELAKLEDRPWPEYGRARKPITPASVARLLKPFGIRPDQQWDASRNLRSYKVDQFADAFARYLSRDLPDEDARTLDNQQRRRERNKPTA